MQTVIHEAKTLKELEYRMQYAGDAFDADLTAPVNSCSSYLNGSRVVGYNTENLVHVQMRFGGNGQIAIFDPAFSIKVVMQNHSKTDDLIRLFYNKYLVPSACRYIMTNKRVLVTDANGAVVPAGKGPAVKVDPITHNWTIDDSDTAISLLGADDPKDDISDAPTEYIFVPEDRVVDVETEVIMVDDDEIQSIVTIPENVHHIVMRTCTSGPVRLHPQIQADISSLKMCEFINGEIVYEDNLYLYTPYGAFNSEEEVDRYTNACDIRYRLLTIRNNGWVDVSPKWSDVKE